MPELWFIDWLLELNLQLVHNLIHDSVSLWSTSQWVCILNHTEIGFVDLCKIDRIPFHQGEHRTTSLLRISTVLCDFCLNELRERKDWFWRASWPSPWPQQISFCSKTTLLWNMSRPYLLLLFHCFKETHQAFPLLGIYMCCLLAIFELEEMLR